MVICNKTHVRSPPHILYHCPNMGLFAKYEDKLSLVELILGNSSVPAIPLLITCFPLW